MQPDQPSNYWKHDPDDDGLGKKSEEKASPEMYAPQDSSDSVDTPAPDDKPEDKDVYSRKESADEDVIHWSATEYIHQEKGGMWFVLFILVALSFIALDVFLLQSYTFSAVIVVIVIAVIVLSRRPPREINYTLSGSQGLYIGENLRHFSEFKSFGFIKDQEHNSVVLMPIKRFSPALTVYFPEEVGEELIDMLGARLPMEDLKLDFVDVIVRKLRL